jgi:hypothetical protein
MFKITWFIPLFIWDKWLNIKFNFYNVLVVILMRRPAKQKLRNLKSKLVYLYQNWFICTKDTYRNASGKYKHVHGEIKVCELQELSVHISIFTNCWQHLLLFIMLDAFRWLNDHQQQLLFTAVFFGFSSLQDFPLLTLFLLYIPFLEVI